MHTAHERESRPSAHRSSTPQSKLLEIQREFHVPVDQLFNAFATPEGLKSWWWPQGLHTDHVELDFREGGRFFINMKGFESGGGGGMTGEFEEIEKNKRIVMTDQFADKDGRPISAQEAKMSGEWPEFIYITFDFESVDEHTSRFKLAQQGIPNEMQKDCVQGWSESFDKLEKYLNDRKN